MKFDEYMIEAVKTGVFPYESWHTYLPIGLASEAGEVAGKFGKAIRKDDLQTLDYEAVAAEVGDVLWYAANLAYFMNMSLEEIAKKNIEKLKDRTKRNVIHGDGDNR